MSVVKIRLARGGSKKRPHYKIVVANATAPRDGSFIEKVGYYNPLLPKNHDERFVLKLDRIQEWLKVGAQPTDKVAKFIQTKGGQLPEKIQVKMDKKLAQIKAKASAPKKEAAGEAAAE